MVVKNNFKLIFSYFGLNIKKEWQYKQSFFMQILMMILNDAFFIIQWKLIFSLVDNIGGYGFNEVMLLWAICAGGYGVSHAFFGGAWNIKHMVYDGKLDVFLTQPKNVLLNVCCSKTDISALGDIAYAFVALAIAGAPWWWYLMIIPVSILSGLVYVSVYVVYVSFVFHMKSGDALAATAEGTIVKVGNYPVQIFSTGVKWIFLTAIPAMFYSFLPAHFMFIAPNLWWMLVILAVTIFWVCLAFFAFNKGLKKYNSGSLMGGRL